MATARLICEILLAYVALYPVVTGARWLAGGILFRLTDETPRVREPEGGWPGVTVLIPAYNEELVIAGSIGAARELDYPELEVLVLDDGSADATADRAQEAAEGDPRIRVVRDPVNCGKGDRLNKGFRQAAHDLVVVTDADTHIHPDALRLLVCRMQRSPRLAAVAGKPHVTNRRNLLTSMQTLEAASIIGLIRRTEALSGRVGTVAGVLGLFRREAVLGVGGYDGHMATEDIELSWRLLLDGWHTAFEPAALVGMQVPSSLRTLWAQRSRWARGQGEVLHVHTRTVLRWRNRRLWPLVLEGFGSLIWVLAAVAALVLAAVDTFAFPGVSLFGFALAWGIAIAVIATLQMAIAMILDGRYDPTAPLAMVLGPVYPLFYWMIGAGAAFRHQTVALIKGPRKRRVVWDVPREEVEAAAGEG